ncbi:caspase a-like, partial [Scomber scombrus]
VYTVTKTSIRSRVALLITNIEFKDEEMNRKGSEKDEENMEELLKALGYEVVKYRNLTGKKIEEAVIDFSKHPKLKETDSVFVVIMSRGELGAVLGVDYKKGHPEREQDKFPIDDIYTHLDTEHCPELLNKPKIIIIQADRGEKGGAVLVHDYPNAAVVSDAQQPNQSLSAGEEDIEDYCLRRAHKEKDFIRFLSCTPDTVSYRHTKNGDFLIQYIVDVLNTFAHQDHIEELFSRVMQHFEEDFPSQTKKQMPTKDRCTLPKNFYLFPEKPASPPAVVETSTQKTTSAAPPETSNETGPDDGTEQEMEEMLLTVQESSNQEPTSVVIHSNSNEAEKPSSLPAVEETSTQKTTSAAPPGISNETEMTPMLSAFQESSNQDLTSVVIHSNSNEAATDTGNLEIQQLEFSKL